MLARVSFLAANFCQQLGIFLSIHRGRLSLQAVLWPLGTQSRTPELAPPPAVITRLLLALASGMLAFIPEPRLSWVKQESSPSYLSQRLQTREEAPREPSLGHCQLPSSPFFLLAAWSPICRRQGLRFVHPWTCCGPDFLLCPVPLAVFPKSPLSASPPTRPWRFLVPREPSVCKWP